MQQFMEALGRQAALIALSELSTRSMGAITGVDLIAVHFRGEGADEHWAFSWCVDMAGLGQDISMVLLPEFIDDPEGPDWLSEQMAAYIIEQAIADRDDVDG